jgi:hypothetical protein
MVLTQTEHQHFLEMMKKKTDADGAAAGGIYQTASNAANVNNSNNAARGNRSVNKSQYKASYEENVPPSA